MIKELLVISILRRRQNKGIGVRHILVLNLIFCMIKIHVIIYLSSSFIIMNEALFCKVVS